MGALGLTSRRVSGMHGYNLVDARRYVSSIKKDFIIVNYNSHMKSIEFARLQNDVMLCDVVGSFISYRLHMIQKARFDITYIRSKRACEALIDLEVSKAQSDLIAIEDGVEKAWNKRCDRWNNDSQDY